MSCRLCCYKEQQHSKLLTQFVFTISVFFNTCTKTCITAWLPYQKCADPVRLSGYVNAVHWCHWSALCRPSPALLTTLYSPQWAEYSLEFPLSTDQLSCEPYGRAHCLVETCKTLTADEYLILAEVFTSEGLCGSIGHRLWQQGRRNGCWLFHEPTLRQTQLKNSDVMQRQKLHGKGSYWGGQV